MNFFIRYGMILIVFIGIVYFSFNEKQVDYEQIADKITIATAKKIKNEQGLFLVGIGGRMMHDIQMMAMSFDYYKEANLDKARELTLTAIEKYLTAINDSEQLRPYLHEYPFNVKNVEIRIWFPKNKMESKEVACLSETNGNICYYINNDQDVLELIKEETFEEAKKNVVLK